MASPELTGYIFSVSLSLSLSLFYFVVFSFSVFFSNFTIIIIIVKFNIYITMQQNLTCNNFKKQKINFTPFEGMPKLDVELLNTIRSERLTSHDDWHRFSSLPFDQYSDYTILNRFHAIEICHLEYWYEKHDIFKFLYTQIIINFKTVQNVDHQSILISMITGFGVNAWSH